MMNGSADDINEDEVAEDEVTEDEVTEDEVTEDDAAAIEECFHCTELHRVVLPQE